ncbi:MAG TPA: hypothetical protein DD395_09040 [Lachnospiraceae bacterium]|nr:hypothetical protein [Lachnospiraceae bacterium]
MRIIAEKSRADYMKARREKQKTFSVAVEKEKMLKFEQRLSEQKKTKSEWLNEKIDEELKK